MVFENDEPDDGGLAFSDDKAESESSSFHISGDSTLENERMI